MDKVLHVAASGMLAQKLNIDVIANNLANVNTTGFKKSMLEFQDLLYENIRLAGESTSENSSRPVGLQLGNGARAVTTHRSFAQGALIGTFNPLDVAIEGDGFLVVQMPNGQTGYTRDGTLKLSADGTIVTSNGYQIEPGISVPEDTQRITISSDGLVDAYLAGETEPLSLGQLELARFVNTSGLNALGRNLYEETTASGPPLTGAPGDDGLGYINQGYLETSNVEVVEEMVAMISAQRAFEINSKAIQTAEEMYDVENRLK